MCAPEPLDTNQRLASRLEPLVSGHGGVGVLRLCCRSLLNEPVSYYSHRFSRVDVAPILAMNLRRQQMPPNRDALLTTATMTTARANHLVSFCYPRLTVRCHDRVLMVTLVPTGEDVH